MPEFVALAHGFPEHPKVMGLHDRAFRFHIVALDYCSRNLTDGHVSARAVKVVAAILDTRSKRWTSELVSARLWRHDDAGDGFWINDYLVYNPRAEAMRDLRDKRREAGVRGAEKRWSKPKAPPGADGNGDGKSHSKSHGKPQIPSEQSSTEGLLEQDPGRQFDADARGEQPEGLPVMNEFLIARIVRLVGDDADSGTAQVIRSKARGLPDASLAKVIESVETSGSIRDRAAYVVAALTSEHHERSAA